MASPGSSMGGVNNTVFISYAREDLGKAKKLYDDLKFAGLDPWLDDESLKPGQKWKFAIEETIKDSRFFVVLFSSAVLNKKNTYVRKEVQHAVDLMRILPQSYIFIIPVRLDSSKIPFEELRDLHYIDLFPKSNWEKGLNRLLTAMDIKLYINKVKIESHFNNNNIEQAYTRALACISSIKYSRIKDKKTNAFIKASLGSHLRSRTISYALTGIGYPLSGIGHALSDRRWLRLDISINFSARKITISDASGFGIKWPAGAKIIKNMRQAATMIKESIEQ
jgi:hypothetical protein